MVNGGLFRTSFRGASQSERTRNLEIPRCGVAHLRSGPEPVIGRRKSADPLGPSRNDTLGRENPVAPGLQSDEIPGPELAVPRGVDLDHGLTAGQCDFGALNRAEGPDMPCRTLRRAAPGGPDLHVMTANKQFRWAAGCAIDFEVYRLAAEL